jgi:hypothetical protein
MTTVRLQSRFQHSISPRKKKSVDSSTDFLGLLLITLVAFTKFAALWRFLFSSPHFGAFHTSHSAHESTCAIEDAYRC